MNIKKPPKGWFFYVYMVVVNNKYMKNKREQMVKKYQSIFKRRLNFSSNTLSKENHKIMETKRAKLK